MEEKVKIEKIVGEWSYKKEEEIDKINYNCVLEFFY